MKKRSATPDEIADAIAAFNHLVDTANGETRIYLDEPLEHLTILEPGVKKDRTRSLRIRLDDGRTFDLRIKPGCVTYQADVVAVLRRRLHPSDVRRAYVIESRVRRRKAGGTAAF